MMIVAGNSLHSMQVPHFSWFWFLQLCHRVNTNGRLVIHYYSLYQILNQKQTKIYVSPLALAVLWLSIRLIGCWYGETCLSPVQTHNGRTRRQRSGRLTSMATDRFKLPSCLKTTTIDDESAGATTAWAIEIKSGDVMVNQVESMLWLNFTETMRLNHLFNHLVPVVGLLRFNN